MEWLGPVELWDDAVSLWSSLADHEKDGMTQKVRREAPSFLPVAQGTDTSMVEDRGKHCFFRWCRFESCRRRRLRCQMPVSDFSPADL